MKKIFLVILFMSQLVLANESFDVQDNVVKHKNKVDDNYQNPTPEESVLLKEKSEYNKLFVRLQKKYPEMTKDEIVEKMTEIWHKKKHIDYNANKAPKKSLNNESDRK